MATAEDKAIIKAIESEHRFFKVQAASEAVALVISWVLIIALVFDYTNVKTWATLEGVVGTFTVIWWMAWERTRLPKKPHVGEIALK